MGEPESERTALWGREEYLPEVIMARRTARGGLVHARGADLRGWCTAIAVQGPAYGDTLTTS
jgi:hypothetical protein